jgi:Tol biopolymer transport system component/DNA-binding winged helix-turn-helix (wHTH) protein
MGNAAMTAVTYEFGDYRLAPAQRQLTRADGTAVRLSGKAFDTLVYLVEHAGQLLDRDVILEAIWPKRVVEDNNLNQAIATLRRVLGEQHVATVAGRGYQFVAPVRRVDRSVDTPARPALTAAHEKLPARLPARSPRLAFAAAAGAGLAVVGLLALGPWTEPPPLTLVDARVTVQPLTTYPGEEITPALSPDGTRVAFSWRPPEGRRGIYVTQVGGREPLRLSEPHAGEDGYPAWSPDGESIAFLRLYDSTRFDVLVMPALGGAPRKLYTGDRWSVSVEGNPLVAWSPDGRYLLFTALREGESLAGSHSLRRLEVATAQVEDLELAREATHYDTSPAISADGRWLAFTRFTRAQRLNQLMVQRLGPGLVPSGEAQVVAGLAPNIHHSLHWSPGADRLWFASSSEIFEWAPGRSPRVIHTLGAQFASQGMAIAARGSGARAVVVMRRSNTDIFALALDSVTHAALGSAEARVPSAATDQHPRVSPDGRSLAFVSDRGGARDLWLADLDGSRPRRLTNMGQLIVGYPRWSPDGQSLSFHASAPGEDRVIYRVDVESGVTARLFNGCCPGDWTADGRSLYVTEIGTVSQVARVDVATGRRARLFPGDVASESADSRFLLYAKAGAPGFFRRPLGEDGTVGEESRLVDDYRVTTGGIAPVADGFFYIGFSKDGAARALRFYDYALGEARDIADVPARVAIGLSVTPDGRQIFYAATGGTPEADIDVIDFDPDDEE